LRRVLWLHVLVHRDDALEAAGLGLILLACCLRNTRLDRLELLDTRLDPLLVSLQQALADIELACAGIELLAARLQPFEHGSLLGRDRRGLCDGGGHLGRSGFARTLARRLLLLWPADRSRDLGCRLL